MSCPSQLACNPSQAPHSRTYLPRLVKSSTAHPMRSRRLNRVDNQIADLLPHILTSDLEPLLPLILLAQVMANHRRTTQLDRMPIILEVVQPGDDLCGNMSAAEWMRHGSVYADAVPASDPPASGFRGL